MKMSYVCWETSSIPPTKLALSAKVLAKAGMFAFPGLEKSREMRWIPPGSRNCPFAPLFATRFSGDSLFLETPRYGVCPGGQLETSAPVE